MRRFLDYSQPHTIEEELNRSQKDWVDSVLRNSAMSSAKGYDRDDSLSFSDHAFGGTHTRIDIPTEEVHEVNETVPHQGVQEHLHKHGYVIENYKDGLAVAPDGRKMRIGRVLERTNAPQEIKNAFTNDVARKSAKIKRNLPDITITRHPYDVAGMSTNRGWRSCMTLPGDMTHVSSFAEDIEDMPEKEFDQLQDAGSNFGKVAHDIAEGTHVAYLGGVDDPVARINLKPLHATDEKGDRILQFLRPVSRDYGNGPEAFPMTVRKWTETHFPARPGLAYRMPKQLYNDGMDDTVYENSKETRKILLDSTMPKSTLRHYNAYDRHILSSILTDENIEPENVKHVWDTYHEANKISMRGGKNSHIVNNIDNAGGLTSLNAHLVSGKLGKSAHDDAVAFISNPTPSPRWPSAAERYARFLINSPHTTPKEIEDMYSAIDSESESKQNSSAFSSNFEGAKIALIHGQKTHSHTILAKAATDKSGTVVESAVGHDSASPDIIEIGLQHRNLDIKNAAAAAKNITDEQTHKILDNHYLGYHGAIGTKVRNNWGGMTNAYEDMVEHRLRSVTPINESHIRKIAQHADYARSAFREVVFSHQHSSMGVQVPEDIIQKAIQGEYVKNGIYPFDVLKDSPHIQKSHLDFALSHTAAPFHYAVAWHPKATKEHLEKIANDPRNQDEERMENPQTLYMYRPPWSGFTYKDIAEKAKYRLESGEYE